jgi:hypothetical protein
MTDKSTNNINKRRLQKEERRRWTPRHEQKKQKARAY